MMESEIVIYEEETTLIWGLVVVVASAFATYLLGDAFINESLFIIGFRQLISLSLFILAFIGILRVTEPLYKFELSVAGNELVIRALKGEDHHKTLTYRLSEIAELRFAPKTPTSENEALFDFSSNYHVVYQSHTDPGYHRLIDLGDVSFTLKVPDVAKVIRFIRRHNPSISIPAEQEAFLS